MPDSLLDSSVLLLSLGHADITLFPNTPIPPSLAPHFCASKPYRPFPPSALNLAHTRNHSAISLS